MNYHYFQSYTSLLIKTSSSVDHFIFMQRQYITAKTGADVEVQIPKVIGQLEFVGIIGAGANAVVYEARDQRTGKNYACKVFNRKYITDVMGMYGLEQEVRASERIRNPHIVAVKETLYDKNNIVIVMELCKKSLLTSLSYGYPLSTERGRFLFCQMLLGVAYLHQRNISHGDIKPDNLLFDDEYNIKLADFGCVRLDGEQTYHGHGGTPLYMAPELFTQNTKYVDHRPADIWALGVVLYAMFSGRLPWMDGTPEDIQRQIMEGDIYYPEYFPREVVDIVSRCCAKEPKERPTAFELLNHPYLVELVQSIREKDAMMSRTAPKTDKHKKMCIMAPIKRIHASTSDSRTLARLSAMRGLGLISAKKSTRSTDRPFKSFGSLSSFA